MFKAFKIEKSDYFETCAKRRSETRKSDRNSRESAKRSQGVSPSDKSQSLAITKWNGKGSPVRDRYLGERTADGDFFPTALVVLDHSRQRLRVPQGLLGG